MRLFPARDILIILTAFAVPALAGPAGSQQVAAVAADEIRDWDARIERMLAAGELVPLKLKADTLLPGREHLRLGQVHRGVPVLGGELVRQTEGERTVSVFGTVYEGIDVDPVPVLTADQAAAVVEKLASADLGPGRPPELLVLPLKEGGYALTWAVRIFAGGDLTLYYVDAKTGAVVKKRSDLKTQTAVGTGTGVLADQKKMSARSASGTFLSDDTLRPPSLVTFDMRGNVFRLIGFLNGSLGLTVADVGTDSDNTWGDGAVVDAHSYAGWTYDYFFKQFGRRGLDNNDLEILSFVHPVRREDLFTYSDEFISIFFLNAFYAGDGIMVYGEGLPSNLTLGGQRFNFWAGALDVVAHELTHGVTDYSSRLFYEGESGALNESFSDMMAAGAEFFHQPAGNGPMTADYLVGEDVVTPGGIRSMRAPTQFGDPDHYSIRFQGDEDNGGVHINSGIPNHAFFLAIEGGTNRVSGQTVQGVGASNRDQVEKVMYRGFTLMMPPRASFSTARAVTIQSARDLYGAGSAAERAISQAWSAVGVQ